ncbi:PQQ-binding-like beta-propeller repeat protein [Cellulomonas sp. Root485]|uniref:outer membrane protein assembly factor BamB family protein n=1 Tax=Cellulomonas sp. Root485 TaxID=1736546 RepID=UPI0012F836BF|nr:PQQ-binding-like beta-propeller repeat protein [Cellulomonas sp. Root485]
MPGRMREVELVEAVDELEQGRSRPGPRVPEPLLEVEDVSDDVLAARTWVRRHAPWLVASVALVIGSLAVTQLVLDHREDARVAALAAIPGIVPPVDASIGVLWRAGPELAPVLQSGAVVDDRLVGGVQDASGNPVIVGLDPGTGAVAWRTPVDLPTPQPTPTSASPELWISCSAVPHGESQVAACVSQQFGEEVRGIPPSSVWVIDPADGRLLADREVEGGWGLAFVDDSLVVAQPVPDATGRWEVGATDIVSGAARWTWTTPRTVAARDEEPSGTASLQAFDDDLVLTVDAHAWVLSAAGEPGLDVQLDDSSWLERARSGVFIESTWTSSAYSGTLLLADGTRVPIDETAGWLAVDDGSAPDVLFTVGQAPGGADGLSGRSAATGAVLWHVAGTIVTGLLLDGTVYVATTETLLAVDATTGDVLWTTEIDHMPQQLSTDGRYLLLPGPGVTLEAYTLSDGALAWTADLAQEVAGDRSAVFVQGFQSGWHDPRLYVWMDTGAVAVLG